MKRIICTLMVVLGVQIAQSQSTETHNAIVIGSYNLGGLQVTTIYDQETDCDRKTSPHSAGLFQADEAVTLVFQENAESAEVQKEGLIEAVFADKECAAENRFGNGGDEVSISCAGTCSCSLEGVISNDDSYVTCTCDDCSMEITITSAGLAGSDTSEVVLNDQTQMEVPLLEEFMGYISSQTVTLVEITIYQNGEDTAVLFTYLNGAGEEETILFAKVGGKTYKINCDGPCGCREVYSFVTKSASCSCEDCIMTVEEVSSQ